MACDIAPRRGIVLSFTLVLQSFSGGARPHGLGSGSFGSGGGVPQRTPSPGGGGAFGFMKGGDAFSFVADEVDKTKAK
eukprot:m.43564 g.43564  ORF g.43564 m.43564 type:complete len:78 (+) comp11642_c0_seq1:457-690(+)